MKNRLFKIEGQKMNIFCARFMPIYLGWINNDSDFTFDLVHIIIDLVALGYKPYVHIKLWHTPFKEFFQSRLQNNSSTRNGGCLVLAYKSHLLICLELCNNQNSIQVKYNINTTHLRNLGTNHQTKGWSQSCFPFGSLQNL
jgi:hypothetical protein